MRPMLGSLLAASLALLSAGCTFSSTASEWHGRVGSDGKPVYIKSHTNVGFNLLILLPFVGRTSLPTQIEKITDEIAAEGGDTVRMVESTTENYWYGFSPFTWIITPVVTTVTADYHPSAAVMSKDEAERAKKAAEEKK